MASNLGSVKDATLSEETRILREWTPMILRTILIVATLAIVTGMALMMAREPGYYVKQYRAVQQSVGFSFRQHLSFSQLAHQASSGNPHAIMTIGLIVLTLVPLGRVAFTFLLFLKERDMVFVIATGYVLTGLILGVVLGRIG